jgi:hypothetical protein
MNGSLFCDRIFSRVVVNNVKMRKISPITEGARLFKVTALASRLPSSTPGFTEYVFVFHQSLEQAKLETRHDNQLMEKLGM